MLGWLDERRDDFTRAKRPVRSHVGQVGQTCGGLVIRLSLDATDDCLRLAAMWDAEMESDFAPGGSAAFLLEEAKADFEAGRFKPLDKILADVKAKRGNQPGA